MPETERRLRTKGIVVFGSLTVFLLLLHATDEIARGAAAQHTRASEPEGLPSS